MTSRARLLLNAFAALAIAFVITSAQAQASTRMHARRAVRAAHATPARATPAKPGMPRTLSDVHIEGEIPVPQVLFITARDSRRTMDFQHHRYLKTSLQLGEATPVPTWVAVMNGSPVQSRKEHSR